MRHTRHREDVAQANVLANPALYISIKLSSTVNFTETPGFSITVPSSVSLSNHVGFIAAYDPQTQIWTEPDSAAANVSGQTLTFPPYQVATTMQGNLVYVYALYAQPSAQIRATLALANNTDQVIVGPDGNFWSDEMSGSSGQVTITNIDRLTPSGTLTRFTFTPGNTCGLTSMVGGTDKVWLLLECINNGSASFSLDSVASDGSITTYTLPNVNSTAGHLALGSDGNVYFSIQLSAAPWTSYLEQVTPAGQINQQTLSGSNVPNYPLAALTAASNGNLWFMAGNEIGQVSTGGVISNTTFLSNPPQPQPSNAIHPTPYIVQASDGNVYAGVESSPLNGGNYTAFLNSLTPGGADTYYQISPTSQGGGIDGLTKAADGSVWFLVGNDLGHVSTNGIIEYNLPALNSSFPLGLVGTTDGSLWVYSQLYDTSGGKTSSLSQVSSANP